MTDRDMTVEYIGTLFGRSVFVAPFQFDDERNLFNKRLREVFGLPEPEDEGTDQ